MSINPSYRRLVLASNNAGKLKELATILSAHDIELIAKPKTQLPQVAETGLSFIENAIIKARHFAKHLNCAALADDSGLSVSALGGAPGIYSSRFGGKNATDAENNAKLLAKLEGVKNRSAAFHCAIAVVTTASDPAPIVAHGIWQGSILEALQGDNGFGYDPLFYVAEHQKSAAELTVELKNSISHRHLALRELLLKLKEI